MAAAQTRMKALVASRLMMGDLPNWAAFERERSTAGMIANRRTARSVSSQIRRGYRELSTETHRQKLSPLRLRSPCSIVRRNKDWQWPFSPDG